MITVECARCGKAFGAQRKTAQYCSVACRTAATRARQRSDTPPPRREGAQVYAIAPKPVTAGGAVGFLARTREKLEIAGREDTHHGMAAVFAATVLDSGVQDTMSSMATMLKLWSTSMEQALDGAGSEANPLRQRREARDRRTA